MSEAKEIQKARHMNRDTRQNIVILLALAVMYGFFGVRSPYFLQSDNIITILAAAVPLGLIGIGECLCLLTGNFDMSVGMVASLAGIIWCKLIVEAGMPTYLAFTIALAFGLVSGLLAGLSVAYLDMPAWMTTYALFQIWKGVIYILTNGEAIRMTRYKTFKFLGQGKAFNTNVPWSVVILLAIYAVMYFVLKYTKLGRDLFVVGGNIEAARNAGLRVKFCKTFVFVLSGVLSALGGALFASRSGSGQPIIGELYAMQAIAGAVVGGTGMAGGKANIAMTFVGILIVVGLQNGLNMIGVPSQYQYIATGLIVVLAILVQTERKK